MKLRIFVNLVLGSLMMVSCVPDMWRHKDKPTTPTQPTPEPEIVTPEHEPAPAPQNSLIWDASTGELVYGTHRYKMVYVEGGSFDMGATPEQEYPEYGENPVHRVTLSSYSIGQTEVPQWLWVAVMGSNPSNWQGDNLPVEYVSWDDCEEFIGKLNSLTGQQFCLPTEAQWEYAARGGRLSKGHQYSGSDSLGVAGWYDGNSDHRTHEVGQKKPNELGLYDMSGNVSEWCSNFVYDYPDHSVTNPKGPSSGTYRTTRGGNWFNAQGGCRVARRFGCLVSAVRDTSLGFRLAL